MARMKTSAVSRAKMDHQTPSENNRVTSAYALPQHLPNDDLMEDSKGRRTVIGRAVDTALVPLHAAISKPAQKAYLGTFLFAATSLILFGISSLAYTLFYYNYVPQTSVERVIHLQFGSSNPYGTAALSSALTSLQAYDVTLSLHLPRTPSNLAAGNFMLDLSLLAPDNTASSDSVASKLYGNTSASILSRSRRPAILTYASPIVDTANTLYGLPWHVLGWKQESEKLQVNMFEGVEFAKGWANVPQSVKVVVESDEKMQFYQVGIKIIARFGGLRWILYHHRIISFVFFTTMFWSSSMLSMLLAWFVLSSYLSAPNPTTKTESDTNGSAIKHEREDSETFDHTSIDDISDTPRSFPTLGRQMPLQFTGRSSPVKKKEDEEVKREEDKLVGSTGIQPLIAEADDEDDEAAEAMSGWRDSGLGTGLEEDRMAGVQRRRKGVRGDSA